LSNAVKEMTNEEYDLDLEQIIHKTGADMSEAQRIKN